MRSQRDLQRKVAVVTGGSSGLGQATAIEMVERGATVIVAARHEAALRETVMLCNAGRAGDPSNRAFYCVTDVTREDQVQNLVQFAVAPQGRIDVWVNNAGTTLFGALDQGPFESHRRVIETNLIGPMLCARAVLPLFREQGSGIMINVGSVLSRIGQPFVPSYVISKFGLQGLSEALRADVADLPDVHICMLFPYAMNTPHFESGANYVGWRAHAMPPDQRPETAAKAIADLAVKPRRNRYVPRAALLGLAAHEIAPRTTERLIHDALKRWHFAATPEEPSDGNLYRPLDHGDVRGHRPPNLSATKLVTWVMLRLIVMKAGSASKAVQSLAATAKRAARLLWTPARVAKAAAQSLAGARRSSRRRPAARSTDVATTPIAGDVVQASRGRS